MAGKTENGSLNPWRLLVTNAVKCPLTIGSGSPVIQARPSEMTARTTSSVCRLTVNWLQVAEDSFRANPCWMALFLRFPSADLKIGAIARIVVGCYRIRHNQSVARARPAAGWYGAGRRWARPVQRGAFAGSIAAGDRRAKRDSRGPCPGVGFRADRPRGRPLSDHRILHRHRAAIE